MKILVFGSREWANEPLMRQVLSKIPGKVTLVHGAAPGADSMAGRIGKELGFEVRAYPADWTTHGKAAGPIRNRAMLQAEHPDQEGELFVKAFGFSTGIDNKGTRDMAEVLWKAKVRFEILF